MVHSWTFMLFCPQKNQTIQLLKNQLLKLLELSFLFGTLLDIEGCYKTIKYRKCAFINVKKHE